MAVVCSLVGMDGSHFYDSFCNTLSLLDLMAILLKKSVCLGLYFYEMLFDSSCLVLNMKCACWVF